MSRQFLPVSRRRFLQSTTLGAAAAASGFLRAPAVLRAQGASVKVGVLHPVSGALSYSGQQGRIGAVIAIEEISAAGGIKALGGAKIEAVLGDAQSTPEGGNAEVEKMNAAGVAAIVGGYGSSICLAASQAAARYDLPYMVAVGVADGIVTRGLKNTFRFGPGFGVIAKTALDNLTTINDAAGKPAKTVMIVHEDSLFGSGLAKLLNEQLPQRGFQVLETIPHPTPTRDFNNVVLKIKAQNPDIVILRLDLEHDVVEVAGRGRMRDGLQHLEAALRQLLVEQLGEARSEQRVLVHDHHGLGRLAGALVDGGEVIERGLGDDAETRTEAERVLEAAGDDAVGDADV